MLLPLFIGACSSGTSSNGGSAPASAPVSVDRFKELEIVDDAVVNDARASNATDGIWSFRRRMEDLTAAGSAPSATVASWLATWASPTSVNQFVVPARGLVEQKVICPWMQRTSSNECDATCSACSAGDLDLSLAPFRLIGVVNRMDLRTLQTDPTIAGEARYVYGLTSGAGDDSASTPLEMTVIFEYRQPRGDRSLQQVAQLWHALGTHAAFDASYNDDLENVLSTFTAPGLEPGRPLGSSISQVRTNEREFDWAWDMRQFSVGEEGFSLTSLDNTPDETLNGSAALGSFLTSNKEAIGEGQHVLPTSLQGGAIGVISPWNMATVSTSVVEAFAGQTCNGCHQVDQLNVNFHLAPSGSGIAKLSLFMNNPMDPATDELARRTTLFQQALGD